MLPNSNIIYDCWLQIFNDGVGFLLHVRCGIEVLIEQGWFHAKSGATRAIPPIKQTCSWERFSTSTHLKPLIHQHLSICCRRWRYLTRSVLFQDTCSFNSTYNGQSHFSKVQYMASDTCWLPYLYLLFEVADGRHPSTILPVRLDSSNVTSLTHSRHQLKHLRECH